MADRFLTGQTAWITGASRGVGRALAMALADAGATVVLGSRDEESLAQIVTILTSRGAKAIALPLDLTRLDSIEAFAERALTEAGNPSILINNAGVGLFKDFTELPYDEFQNQIAVNLTGPWRLTQLAAARMKLEGDGSILFISSIAGEHAFKRGSAYCPSKAAVNALSETLMLELREYGIRVTTVAPGSIKTSFHQQALPAAHHNDQDWMMTPDHIAKACLDVLRLPKDVIVSFYEIRPLRTGGR